MLKVALVSDAFLPIIDGVCRVVYEYANALGTRGHECYVIAPLNDSGYRAQYPFEIIDFQGVTLPGNARYLTGVASLDKHYMTRISTVELDVIHAHSPGPAALEAIRLSSKLKVPLIGTFHSKLYDDFYSVTRSEGLATLGVKYVVDFYDRCDEVWAVSNFAADVLREYGYKGRIEIVQNGINFNLPQAPREQAATEARAAFSLPTLPILLYVGQMHWKKNIRCILEAAGLLYRSGWEFCLVLAGQGPDFDEIRAFALEQLPKDYVCFTGHITDDMLLHSLYHTADLFVFPSDYDTAGLVVREAAIAGTPSVVLRNSAPAEVIRDGQNGLTCENNPRSLADTVAHALNDPERLALMGKNAKQDIPVSWDTVMDEVIDRYQHVVDRAHGVLKRKRGIFRKELTAIDQTLEKRTMDLLWRFLKQDAQHMYAYEYSPCKTQHTLAESTPLPRSAPEEQGIASARVLELYRAMDADADTKVHTLLVLRNGHVIAEGAWAPYDCGLAHQLYSMSKSVTATAIGMLVDEGKLALEERLVDIFEDKIADKETHPMRACTVFHLLTMSTGVRFNEIGSALGRDWEQEFLDSGVQFEAGTQFFYNSMNTYMLSAIVRRRAGCSMMQYLRPRLFEPLQIANASWEVCPLGTEKGGWGLSLLMEDVAKIGLLYLQKGKYLVHGEWKQLISSQWISEATRKQIETPQGECKDGYGYQIWMGSASGSYLFNGAFGQYMLALPEANTLFVMFSGCSRLFADGDLMRYALDCLNNAAPQALMENPRGQRVLQNTLSMLSTLPRQRRLLQDHLPLSFQQLIEQLNGVSCIFKENTAGLLPIVLQTVQNNFSTGIRRISFKTEDKCLLVSIAEGETTHELQTGEGFFCGTLTIRDETYKVSVGANCGMQPSGDLTLQLFIYFIETPCVRVLTFEFREDGVTLCCDEDPTVNATSAMLMDLAGLTQTELFRGILSMFKRASMQNRMRSYTTATLTGLYE